MQKRRQFSAGFKAKVAIEVLKVQRTFRGIGQKYRIHPNQIFSMEQEFLQNSANLFTNVKKKEKKEDTAKLYEEIGR